MRRRGLIRPVFMVGIWLVWTAQLGGQPPITPVITNAVADLDAKTLSLFGANFGSNPQVFIGSEGALVELMVNFATSTDGFIEAALGSPDPGTYSVVVSTGPNQIQMAAMDLTIGAVGPEGPEGPSRPPGTPNPNIITEGSSTFNTAIGVDALVNNNGINNTASGALALAVNDAGSFNTATGSEALASNASGNSNTATGYRALTTNTSGFRNTASGQAALRSNTTGNNNTASGVNALRSNTTGFFNTANGSEALANNTTGFQNTASGGSALTNNTTGSNNTAGGQAALHDNTSGGGNTATGTVALGSNITGANNTATGLQALINNTGGGQNTAVGAFALGKNDAVGQNTAVGGSALENSTGSWNIGIGFAAGRDLEVGDNNIYIGNPGGAMESNIIRIGDAGHTAFIAGFQFPPLSSMRFKENIRDMGQGSSSLMRLRPVTFRYRKEYAAGDQRLKYGLIAEEVAEVYPELVVHDDTGRVRTVLYQELNAMLLNELQKQHRQIQDLTERLARMEQTLTARHLLTSLEE